MSEQLSIFDYNQLSPELAIEARVVADRVRLRMRRAAEDIIEIGKDLIEMKAKLPHGQFEAWIKAEFEMSLRTASNFMSVAARFCKSANFADFSPSVLYTLAAPSTPDEVIEKAIERAESGEKVSVKEVQELKKELLEVRRRAEIAEKEKSSLQLSLDSKVEQLALQQAKALTEGYESQLEQETRKAKELIDRLKQKEDAIAIQKESHQKEIDRLKKNPDPDMKARLKELQDEVTELSIKKSKIDREIRSTENDLKSLAEEKDNLLSNTTALNLLLSALDRFERDHSDEFRSLYSDRVSPEARDRKRATAARWRDFWIGVLESDSGTRRVQDVDAIVISSYEENDDE